MLLEDKNAVIYGGGSSIGGAVARAFAREGARVFLAGRTLAKLDEVAQEIRSAGGVAEATQVDALDEQAVEKYVDEVAEKANSIDVSFNLISYEDVQGTPLAEMTLEDFERPVVTAVRAQFLTSRAAARHMISQGSGVILFFGGAGGRDPIRDYMSGGFQVYLGGFQVALGALDVLRRQLAVELGPHGIRVVTLQSGGVPETTREDWREAITQSFVETFGSALMELRGVDPATAADTATPAWTMLFLVVQKEAGDASVDPRDRPSLVHLRPRGRLSVSDVLGA